MALKQKGIIPAGNPTAGSSWKCNPNSNSALYQIENLPSEYKCALFITIISAAIGLSEFFDTITNEAVWVLNINPPTAKLVFMSPYAAQSCINRLQIVTGISLCGSRLKVRYNRAGYLQNDGNATRILQIKGPTEIMKWQYWKRYFDGARVFELDRWIIHPCPDSERARMEVGCARVDGQAQMCLQKTVKDMNLEIKGTEFVR
ncbi:hypothetical protein L207DRAFT_576320 [Hyaloscypha variabilis F]|uniref:Uncharacterized protein n=1 Tax=Hyaloscypha variabilis (strain UAMH 11265 / GT02V1 / F) TaxID=1149755 RepID=A0A2J6S9V8_HYAVF|nr:hypothetical protein L207DRAFT_576320 [Hyaloscypha variabilis F]